MNSVLTTALLICVVAGVASEIITISAPERILSIAEHDPQELFGSRFYRFVFVLSGLYLLGVVLMLVSGVETFRIYAVVLLGLSLAAWLLRTWLLRLRVLQIAESTVCLILLLDVARSLVRAYLP